MSDDSLGRTEEAVEAWLTSYRIFAMMRRGGYHRTGRHGTTEVITGVPMSHLNGLFSSRHEVDVDEMAGFADSDRLRSVDWSIHVRGEAGDRVAALAGDHGLKQRWTLPFLVKDLGANDLRRTADGPATRRIGSDESDLYRRSLMASFTATAKFYDIAGSGALMDYRDSRVHVVEVDGETVASAYGILVDDMVGVFNVAVPPHWRGRGYARAATEAVLRDAYTAGARGAFLHTADVGLPLYQAMGFRVAESWTLFTAHSAGYGCGALKL
jgi:GNAT superfamily N-acetyltransferase